MAVVSLQQSKIINKTPAGQNPKEELSKPVRGHQLIFPAATGHGWHQKTCLRATGSQRTEGTVREGKKHCDNKAWWMTHTEGIREAEQIDAFLLIAVCQTQWIKILLPVY